jgi:hypothetical protein
VNAPRQFKKPDADSMKSEHSEIGIECCPAS